MVEAELKPENGPEMACVAPAVKPGAYSARARRRLWWLAIWAAVVVIGFGKPLYQLVRFAAGSDLYSHILLIPFISGYLVWVKRRSLALDPEPARAAALIPLIAGFGLLGGFWLAVRSGWKPPMADYLAIMVYSFLALLAAGGCLLVGTRSLRAAAFPAGFLIFMAPFPTSVLDWIEGFLQHHSADVACGMFALSGMPVLRSGTELRLPGFKLEVAPECSGIHSTLVLFITSVVAGYLLLRSPWRRVLLSAFVIPLALLRNGFRIFTIGQLCVQVSPDMINSYIHRKGGPIFFVLSLIPFFLLLLYLSRGERKKRKN